MLTFSSFPVGTTGTLPDKLVTAEETIAFARQFDPQPMHLDEAAAQKSLLGGLSASGWHTCAMLMRMICDGYLHNAAGMGSPGLAEVRWLKPVKPGDTLSATYCVTEARRSASRPGLGVCRILYDVTNQHGTSVMSWDCVQFFADEATSPVAPATSEAAPSSRPPAASPIRTVPPGEPPGEPSGEAAPIPLGSYTFTAEAIVAFAAAYDPQPFHLSQAAGEKSVFGRLTASGWHTAAVWMKLMVAHMGREAALAKARGQWWPKVGPSPGFRDLRWLKPVRPGDTLAYSTQPLRTEARPGRPDWNLLAMRNEARNQAGELVFSFEGRVLVEAPKPASP